MVARGTHHIVLTSTQALTAKVQTDKTARASSINICTISSEIEKPADSIGIEARLHAQSRGGSALFAIFIGEMLPVVREYACVDRCFCADHRLYW